MLNFHNSYYVKFFCFMFVVFNQSILVMKIRVFVNPENLYDSVVIDTESLTVSYFSSTGHIQLLSPGIYSTLGDPMPSLFICDLINDLIDAN